MLVKQNQAFALFLVACFFSACSNSSDKKVGDDSDSGKSMTNGVEIKYYPKTDVKASEITFKDGSRNGSAKTYFKNGQVNKEGFYKNNRKHGRFVTYFENGIIRKSVEYRNNLKDGWDSLFYKSGNPLSAVLYKMGDVQQGTVEWDRYKKKHTTSSLLKAEVVNRIQTQGEAIVYVSLEAGYTTELIEIALKGNGTLENPEFAFEPMQWSTKKKGKAKYVFELEQGYEFVGKLIFRARGKTKNKRPFVTYELFPIVLN